MKKNNQKKQNKKVILEVRDLTKKFRIGENVRTIFDKISFTLFEGEILAIFGKSGTGKTLLMQVLTGLEEIESGSIYLEGINYQDLNSIQKSDLTKSKFGLILREDNLINELSVTENIALFQNIKSAENQDYEQYLSILELEGIMSRKILELNWLEYQKVTFLCALMNSPKIIFMDEPTGNLNEAESTEFMNLVKEINKKFGQTFIIFSHDPKIAVEVSKVVRI